MQIFKFHAEFVGTNDQVLKVECVSETKEFNVMVDKHDDQYYLYYSSKPLTDDEETDFKNQLFGYLANEYPTYF